MFEPVVKVKSIIILMPCPFIGPKLFWTIQFVLVGYRFKSIFLIWTCPKQFGHAEIDWTVQNSKTIHSKARANLNKSVWAGDKYPHSIKVHT